MTMKRFMTRMRNSMGERRYLRRLAYETSPALQQEFAVMTPYRLPSAFVLLPTKG